MQHNHTEEKAERFKNGDEYAFVNPEEWNKYDLWCIEYLENMVEIEKKP